MAGNLPKTLITILGNAGEQRNLIQASKGG
jgi:hypothetical protein